MKIRNKLSENMFCPTAGTFRNLVEVGGGGGGGGEVQCLDDMNKVIQFLNFEILKF